MWISILNTPRNVCDSPGPHRKRRPLHSGFGFPPPFIFWIPWLKVLYVSAGWSGRAGFFSPRVLFPLVGFARSRQGKGTSSSPPGKALGGARGHSATACPRAERHGRARSLSVCFKTRDPYFIAILFVFSSSSLGFFLIFFFFTLESFLEAEKQIIYLVL